MSIRRLALTCAAMAAAALALSVLTPGASSTVDAVANPQRTVDVQGADALLVSVTGLLAWGIWSWGALGLLLTAGTAVPGALGATARALVRVLLPAAARHAAAVALGAGLAAPVLLVAPLDTDRPATAAAQASLDVPDWPLGDAGRVPDWPSDATAAAHVVVPGDCLWDIAEHRLTASGAVAGDAEVAVAVHRWWAANRGVIGADPDLIRPGQVLSPPPS